MGKVFSEPKCSVNSSFLTLSCHLELIRFPHWRNLGKRNPQDQQTTVKNNIVELNEIFPAVSKRKMTRIAGNVGARVQGGTDRNICRKSDARKWLACCTFSKSETHVDKFTDSPSARFENSSCFQGLSAKCLWLLFSFSEQSGNRAVFKWRPKVIARFRLLPRLVIGLRISSQFFNQWEAKPKPIAPQARDFFYALSKLQVTA